MDVVNAAQLVKLGIQEAMEIQAKLLSTIWVLAPNVL